MVPRSLTFTQNRAFWFQSKHRQWGLDLQHHRSLHPACVFPDQQKDWLKYPYSHIHPNCCKSSRSTRSWCPKTAGQYRWDKLDGCNVLSNEKSESRSGLHSEPDLPWFPLGCSVPVSNKSTSNLHVKAIDPLKGSESTTTTVFQISFLISDFMKYIVSYQSNNDKTIQLSLQPGSLITNFLAFDPPL